MSTLEIPEKLIAALRAAKHVVVLTGAGISAESGVPTFRDAQTGLWAKYKPEELATPEAFLRDPKLVWEWYMWRRSNLAVVHPNAGHLALVLMERRTKKFTLITQNVDGLHQQAGSRHVIELHGNIARTKCFDEGTLVTGWLETGELPPRCPHCGARLRPDVVWFGEFLPPEAFLAAEQSSRTGDVFLCVGTSSLVYPAAALPEAAVAAGAILVEINPQVTPLTRRATYVLSGPAGEVLPALVAAVWG